MRVAYLTHYADRYGANRSLLDLVVRLKAAEGVEPFVILAREGPLQDDLAAASIEHVVIPFPVWMAQRVYMGGPHHRLRQWWGYRSARRSRAHAGREALPALKAWCGLRAIQLVHSNSAVIGVGGPLARALGVPHVWHIRELPRQHYGLLADGGTQAQRQALRAADALIAVSAAVRDDLQGIAGGGVHPVVMPNAVASAARLAGLAAEADRRWTDTHPFRFAMVGLFHTAKGQLEAVEAFARVLCEIPDAHLELAGGGDVGPVRRRIAELGIADHVSLPGQVDDPFAVFARAHCALMTSRHEAFGRATAEAMVSGIPVIGHASGGTPELVQEGITGHLYTTPEELAMRMLERMRDPVGTAGMGRSAMRRVTAMGTVEDHAARVARLYCSLLQ